MQSNVRSTIVTMGHLSTFEGIKIFQPHLINNFLRVKYPGTFISSLTSFLHSYFNDTRVLFFSSSSCKNSGSSRVSLGQACSGLQLKGSVLCIDHHKFTEAIKSIIPAIQSLEMRISPKPTFEIERHGNILRVCESFNSVMPFRSFTLFSGALDENIAQIHLNIALLNVF